MILSGLYRVGKNRIVGAAAFTIGALLPIALPRPAAAQVITGFEGFTNGVNGSVVFRQPTFSGSTSGFLATTPNLAAISNEQANTGTQSLKVSFQLLANQTNPWVRLTTSGTANLPNPAIDFSLALQLSLYVPASTPDFYITLGARETGTAAAVGANGGTTGTIEYVGATSGLSGGAPIGKLITTKDTWLTVTFNIPSEPVRAFTGNGILEGGRGAMESLTITPASNAVGPYTFYVDDIRQTPIVVASAPEPGSVALLASALLPLGALAASRKRRPSPM